MIKQQQGTSLVEILVTLLILSVGGLGLAAMQVLGIKQVNNSQNRSLAVIYAYDMAERMRSNQAGVAAGHYDGIDTGASSHLVECTTTVCTPQALAQHDAFEWESAMADGGVVGVVDKGLPNVRGTIEQTGDFYTITITWDEQYRDENGGQIDSHAYSLQVRI